MEYNLVEIWLRRDPIRWLSGALGGLVAAAIALIFAMVCSSSMGMDFWFPAQLMGTIIVGPAATEVGNMGGAIPGVILFEALGLFLGFVFAHFTGTNSLKALLPMGMVWGIFSWIFIWNLFLQSFKPINAARIQSGSVLPICMIFGISLVCVAIFDQLFRGKR